MHFNETFKKPGLGLKGQLATDSKTSAIRYKQQLDDWGLVKSAVVISPPDTREGHAEVEEAQLPLVQQWWKHNVKGEPEDYEKAVIEDFGSDGPPDILIVVDKLITGFDEPRNAVLYIDKPLKGHNLPGKPAAPGQAVWLFDRLPRHPARAGYHAQGVSGLREADPGRFCRGRHRRPLCQRGYRVQKAAAASRAAVELFYPYRQPPRPGAVPSGVHAPL